MHGSTTRCIRSDFSQKPSEIHPVSELSVTLICSYTKNCCLVKSFFETLILVH